jgi:hypothetical protein
MTTASGSARGLQSGSGGLARASAGMVGAASEPHSEPPLRLHYFCSPYHQDSALYPLIDQLGRAAGFTRDDPPASRLEKLEALLARVPPPKQDLALLADLLSLPASDRYLLPDLSAQR